MSREALKKQLIDLTDLIFNNLIQDIQKNKLPGIDINIDFEKIFEENLSDTGSSRGFGKISESPEDSKRKFEFKRELIRQW